MRNLGSIQHTIDVVSFGLLSAQGAEDQELKLHGAFVNVVPAQNVAFDFETAKNKFRRWTLTNGIRDCVEGLHAFLEEARLVCFLFSLGNQPTIMGEEWNAGMVDEAKEFHRLGLPNKIDYLSKAYDASLIPEVKEKVLTINQARNCLVHRGGRVAQRDVNCDEGLLVRWQKFELLAKGSDGERQISHGGAMVKAGETVVLRRGAAEKLFKLGDSVDFTVDEFSELCLTLLAFAMQLVKNIEQYGRSKGIPFNATDQESQTIVA